MLTVYIFDCYLLLQGIAKQLLFPFIPQFTQAFIQALQVPDGLTSDSGLKMEIVKVMSIVEFCFSEELYKTKQ